MLGVDWSKIETVLLDMDGTLLDLRFDTEFWTRTLPAHYADEQEFRWLTPAPTSILSTGANTGTSTGTAWIFGRRPWASTWPH